MNSKVALIIGAGTSLGSSITKVFADDNFTVVPARREGEKLKPLEEEINSKGGKCFSFSLDARKEDEVQNFIERVEQEIGEIEVAVYNIGANIKYNLTETFLKKIF
jgi:NADP-dependent 3-hydroxy acid dehydrogenase YdfG